VFGRAIAEHFHSAGIELVASPAIGGIIIGHEVARAGVRFLWTEREGGVMTLRRGFSVARGERTFGCRGCPDNWRFNTRNHRHAAGGGAEVIGAASIIDRSSGSVDVGVPRIALATLDVTSNQPSICEAAQEEK
jgi:orotate phosphoribosyltransferase